MKTVYLDCGMGAAGDMLAGALLELTEDPEEALEELNLLGVPGLVYQREKVVKCGVTGTHLRVLTDLGEEGGEERVMSPASAPCHELGKKEAEKKPEGRASEERKAGRLPHHHHTTLAFIQNQIASLAVTPKVRMKILAVYGRLARAESLVHGRPIQQIHFHEVGTMDALGDITAFCYLMERLGWPYVVASPIRVGSGQEKCAHGLLPVPAPATTLLLKGAPVYGGKIEGELCTPTGAALLAEFVKDYGTMPALHLEKVGYGMGKKDFESMNGVRALLGEPAADAERTAGNGINIPGAGTKNGQSDGASECQTFHELKEEKGNKGYQEDQVTELQCNLDDMTGEELGFATERLYEAGALEVFTLPADMKKNRPGSLLTVLCRREDSETMATLIFRYTETLGIRITEKKRYLLKRRVEEVETPSGILHRKVSEGFGLRRVKYEYEELAELAARTGKSLREIRREIEETGGRPS